MKNIGSPSHLYPSNHSEVLSQCYLRIWVIPAVKDINLSILSLQPEEWHRVATKSTHISAHLSSLGSQQRSSACRDKTKILAIHLDLLSVMTFSIQMVPRTEPPLWPSRLIAAVWRMTIASFWSTLMSSLWTPTCPWEFTALHFVSVTCDKLALAWFKCFCNHCP